MRKTKNGVVGWLLICFTLLIVTTAQAYSYSDYYDEDDEEELEYYDYHTGRWEVIPEPDPVSYGGGGNIVMMMPLFIILFVIFFPWFVYALVRAAVGK